MNKNIKISEKHHQILKSYCDRTGLRMYRVIEKWIDELDRTKKDDGLKSKRKDIYDEA
jgi:coproporphyrinogen III oxidase